VREEDGDGPQPVLSEQVVQRLLGAVPRVDDDAFLAGRGSDDPAIGLPRARGEPDDEHGDAS
jgi:hypothetical protein